MAVYNSYVVEYRGNSAGEPWKTISNVQALDCQVGRVLPVDQWRPSSATIRVRYPTGFSSPPADLGINAQIRFFCPGRSSTKPTWTGLVRNVSVEVGIPWITATSTGNDDYLIIECEGAYATTSRQTPGGPAAVNTNYSIRQMLLTLYQTYAIASTNVGVSASSAYIEDSIGGTLFVNNPINTDEALQRWSGTYQIRLLDGVSKTWTSIDPIKMQSWGYADVPAFFINTGKLEEADVASVSFSDTTNDATRRTYDDITFDSLADGYLTAATLETIGGYSYNGSSSTTINRSQTFIGIQSFVGATPPTANTPDVAQTAADYWANAFSQPDIAPLAISATTASQHTQNLDTLGFTDLELGYLPSKAVNITLRGNTYLCRIEGVQLTADLNQSRFTYYISPADTTGWFILDSNTFGVLDQNKLGLY